MQECNLIINKQKIKYLTQKKPSQPTLKAKLKLHKTDTPIRTPIDNIKAPSCKLAKHQDEILTQYITLNNYNDINSTNLANDLTKLKIHEHHNLITFDVNLWRRNYFFLILAHPVYKT